MSESEDRSVFLHFLLGFWEIAPISLHADETVGSRGRVNANLVKCLVEDVRERISLARNLAAQKLSPSSINAAINNYASELRKGGIRRLYIKEGTSHLKGKDVRYRVFAETSSDPSFFGEFNPVRVLTETYWAKPYHFAPFEIFERNYLNENLVYSMPVHLLVKTVLGIFAADQIAYNASESYLDWKRKEFISSLDYRYAEIQSQLVDDLREQMPLSPALAKAVKSANLLTRSYTLYASLINEMNQRHERLDNFETLKKLSVDEKKRNWLALLFPELKGSGEKNFWDHPFIYAGSEKQEQHKVFVTPQQFAHLISLDAAQLDLEDRFPGWMGNVTDVKEQKMRAPFFAAPFAQKIIGKEAQEVLSRAQVTDCLGKDLRYRINYIKNASIGEGSGELSPEAMESLWLREIENNRQVTR